MFSYFFPPAPPSTPFDTCDALYTVRPIINELFAKETELKNAAEQPNATPLTRLKKTIISQTCDDIREAQNAFNLDAKENNSNATNAAVNDFMIELRTAVNETLTNEYRYNALSRHRDADKRSKGRALISYGTKAAIIAPGALVGQPAVSVLVATGMCAGYTSFITRPIQEGLYYATGLSPKMPKSKELLKQLLREIEAFQPLAINSTQAIAAQEEAPIPSLTTNTYTAVTTEPAPSEPETARNTASLS